MSPPPTESGPDRRGAPARLGGRVRPPGEGLIRPEVLEAIDQLEASLVDVARGEKLRASPAGDPEPPDRVDAVAALRSAPPSSVGSEPEPKRGPDPVPILTANVIDDRSRPDSGVGPDVAFGGQGLQTAIVVADTPAPARDWSGSSTLAIEDSLLWQARTIDPPSVAPIDVVEGEVLQRQRRGRLVSWVGVVILVAGAGLWLIPDRSEDPGAGDLPALESGQATSTTVQVDSPVVTSATFTPPTGATTVPGVAPTTVMPDTTVTASRSPANRGTSATTTTTSAASNPTLIGECAVRPRGPSCPTTTTAPNTTTTVPNTTTTHATSSSSSTTSTTVPQETTTTVVE